MSMQSDPSVQFDPSYTVIRALRGKCHQVVICWGILAASLIGLLICVLMKSTPDDMSAKLVMSTIVMGMLFLISYVLVGNVTMWICLAPDRIAYASMVKKERILMREQIAFAREYSGRGSTSLLITPTDKGLKKIRIFLSMLPVEDQKKIKDFIGDKMKYSWAQSLPRGKSDRFKRMLLVLVVPEMLLVFALAVWLARHYHHLAKS